MIHEAMVVLIFSKKNTLACKNVNVTAHAPLSQIELERWIVYLCVVIGLYGICCIRLAGSTVE